MEQKLSDTLVKAIDRSNPMMQNLQLASRFNKIVEQSGGGNVTLYAWHLSGWALYCYTYTENPSVNDPVIGCDYGDMASELGIIENTITAVSENQITIEASLLHQGTYTRDSTKEIVLKV